MKLLDYSYLPGNIYPHQVVQRWKVLGFLISEVTFVSHQGLLWYALPSMLAVSDSEDFAALVRAEAFAAGRSL